MPRDLAPDVLERFTKSFDADPTARMLQNAVTTTSVDDIALDRRVVTGIDHSFSHVLDDWGDQRQKQERALLDVRRLNLFRAGAIAKMGLKDFEFSQNYTLFSDKIERANYFLEAIIDTADRAVDDRTVALPARDADSGRRPVEHVRQPGRKHGLVPKQLMPETQSSSQHPRA